MMMTDAEAVVRPQAIDATNDQEMAHIEADNLLCDLLRELGYPRLVEAFEAMGKWYA